MGDVRISEWVGPSGAGNDACVGVGEDGSVWVNSWWFGMHPTAAIIAAGWDGTSIVFDEDADRVYLPIEWVRREKSSDRDLMKLLDVVERRVAEDA